MVHDHILDVLRMVSTIQLVVLHYHCDNAVVLFDTVHNRLKIVLELVT